jgi:hypothetical protein
MDYALVSWQKLLCGDYECWAQTCVGYRFGHKTTLSPTGFAGSAPQYFYPIAGASTCSPTSTDQKV